MSDFTLLDQVPATKAAAAAWYADKFGWRIMPLHAMRTVDGVPRCSCGDEQCDKPAKHPLVKNGEASSDAATIAAWWKKWPWANIGFWLEGSGLAVLDIDVSPDKDGAARLREHLKGEPIPETLVANTPSGGKHIYYREREGLPNKSNALGAGLDIWRGKHYVILPPSNHRSGGTYEWEKHVAPVEWPDVLMPKRGRPGRPEGTARRERLDVDDADEVKRLAHALTFIDASDRDTWVNVGYVLARVFEWKDRGWELFREWAATAPNFSDRQSKRIYSKDSRNPPDGAPLTSAFIFKKAREHPEFKGWEPSDLREKFHQREGFEGEGLDELGAIVSRADLDVYEREGRLIEVVRVETLSDSEKERLRQAGIARDDAYCITREMSVGQFIAKASHRIAWYRKVRGKMRCTDFDRQKVSDFLNRGEWVGLKRFKAFTMHPTIRSASDPTLVSDIGFDRESCLYLSASHAVSVKSAPNKKDAIAAFNKLMQPFEHFRLNGDEVDRRWRNAKVVALILTIGLRHWFDRVPMFLATAPVVGSGKTKLMTSAAVLWYGAEPPAMGFTQDEEEMEKRIGASIMAGDRVLLFDNVMTPWGFVNDRTLNMILTSGRASFRVLGKSEKVAMRAPMTILMTGNQMTLGPDLTRRTIVLDIDPQGPTPTSRRFPFEPVEFVKANRTALIEAALTLARAYLLDTHARTEAKRRAPVASFEEWTVIRDLVMWLGLPDVGQFGAGADEEEGESRGAIIARLLSMIHDFREINPYAPMLQAQIVPLLCGRGQEWRILFDDLWELFGQRNGYALGHKPEDARTVGTLLKACADQPVALGADRVRLKRVGRLGFKLEVEAPDAK